MLRLRKKKNEKNRLSEKSLAIVLPINSPNRSLEFLIELIDKIRPDNPVNFVQAETRFKALLYQISQDKTLLFSLRKSLLTQFLKTNIIIALTENGILNSRGFFQELMGKLKHKVLPELQTPDNFLYVISKVFNHSKDYYWVQAVDRGLWIQFFERLGIQINLTEPLLIKQFRQALELLSYGIASLGIEKEIMHRYENVEDAIYPFLEQNRLVNEYLLLNQEITDQSKQRTLLTSITSALYKCLQSIHWMKEQRAMYGTSLSQTFIITRLQQQIDRIFIILDVLDTDNDFNTGRFVEYFTTLVKNENTKYSIKNFLSENTSYLAYQIAEHGGRTGEKFITSTRKEFWHMFRSAAGGGVIISFIAVIKNLLGKLQLASFWHGFLYSANYSLGFILIQDTGSTLATKQPAYTANNIASSLDTKKAGEEPDLKNLAITIAKVCRTQLASFTGNLLFVLPLTYMLAWLFFKSTGVKIASGDAAYALLAEQQPFHSLALLYACFTGFFLFASGIIAGYVENYVVYGKIAVRLRNHSTFKKHINEKRRYRFIHYIENNLGALSGNISLGFFLGMAGFFGNIFGLTFGVRHITISAANAVIGFFGIGSALSIDEVIYTLAGVCAIGFVNFAVSFALAFIVAVKSRGIHLRSYPEFMSILWHYFKKYPADFFKAPSSPRTAKLM